MNLLLSLAAPHYYITGTAHLSRRPAYGSRRRRRNTTFVCAPITHHHARRRRRRRVKCSEDDIGELAKTRRWKKNPNEHKRTMIKKKFTQIIRDLFEIFM